MSALDNGAVVTAMVLGPALLADGEVVRRGHRAFCEHAREHPKTTAVGLVYLALHILRPPWLPAWVLRLDPLSAAARRLIPKEHA